MYTVVLLLKEVKIKKIVVDVFLIANQTAIRDDYNFRQKDCEISKLNTNNLSHFDRQLFPVLYCPSVIVLRTCHKKRPSLLPTGLINETMSVVPNE